MSYELREKSGMNLEPNGLSSKLVARNSKLATCNPKLNGLNQIIRVCKLDQPNQRISGCFYKDILAVCFYGAFADE